MIRRHWGIDGLLAAFVGFSFPAVLLGLKTFYFRDFGYFGYPFAFYYRQSFWQHQLPLWNPYNNAGIPFLAQWNTLVLYPLSLVYLLLPLPWSLNLFCLGHLVLAGAGMARFARSLTGEPLSGIVAGAAFAFSAFTLNCLVWPHMIAALGWMPWVIWLGIKALEAGGRSLIPAVAAGAMQMLTGAPEIILMTWMLLTFFACLQLWEKAGCRRQALFRLTALVLFVAGLSAVQLLPFLDLLRHSHRDTRFGDSAWAMPPWGTLNWIAPLFRTYRIPQGVFFQFGQDWISSYYPGITVVLLAAAGFLKGASRRQAAIALLLLLSAWLALGEKGLLYAALQKVFPFLGFMRYPVKFVAMASFCFPLLAAISIARWIPLHNEEARPAKVRPLALICAGFLLALALALFISYRFPIYQERVADTWLFTASRGVFLLGAATLIVLLWRGSALPDHPTAPSSGAYSGGPASRRFAQMSPELLTAALAALIWLDLLTYAPDQNPAIEPEIYRPGLAVGNGLEPPPRVGVSRALITRQAYESFYRKMLPNGASDYFCHRLGLFSNCNLLDGVPVTDGFYSLHLKESRAIWSACFEAPNLFALAPLLDFLSVAYLSSPTNELFFARRQGYLPVVSIGQQPVFVEPASTLGLLTSPGFDPRAKVYLPSEAAHQVQARSSPGGRVISASFSPHRVIVEIDTPERTMAVFGQSYYHPWQAVIDSSPVPLWRANGAFQAVEAPAGRHTIELVYRDRMFVVGAIISATTFLLLGLLRLTGRLP